MQDNHVSKGNVGMTYAEMVKWIDVLRGFDQTEKRFLIDGLREHKAGNVTLEVALAKFQDRVTAYRARLKGADRLNHRPSRAV